MITTFFELLILGHLAGDYLFQNKSMAMNKQGNWWMCSIHCIIYTIVVSAFTYPIMWRAGIWWPCAVFLTHFPVDYFSLADKWLKFIEGRSLTDFIKNGKNNIPEELDKENYHALRGGFTAVVYAAADNAIHLILMYWAACLLV